MTREKQPFSTSGSKSRSTSGGAAGLCDLSLSEASNLIDRREISPVELTLACLERIERLNPLLNAFITVANEQALEAAKRAESEIHSGGRRGPLHGIPIALKDNVDTAGLLTTAGSAVFADRTPEEDAEVVVRLKKAGAILLGKLNLHEFAFGTTSLISHRGAVVNPWNRERIAGGSSGGSAAAVAAGLCYGAIGTDTAGSIRLPAACCGIVGFKPTHGLVSIRGIIPLSVSFDHAGPICRTVSDAALMLQVLAGYDPDDPCSIEATIPDYSSAFHADPPVRVGIVRRYVSSEEAQRCIASAHEALGSRGTTFCDVHLPEIPGNFWKVFDAEVYAFHEPHLKRSAESYDPATREKAERCRGVTRDEYEEGRALVGRLRREITDVFSDVDLLLTPTIPAAVPKVVDSSDPVALSTAMTRPFNVFGLPAISVPCGFSEDETPLGLQIVGPRLGELQVLSLAHRYEQAAGWHSKRPPL